MKLVSIQGKLLADSREIADVTGKLHKHLLRDIDLYASILTESKIGPSDFFIESSYVDSTGRTLKCYLLTRKGCDMVANKMTGEKGILFTAAYVTKFEEMEKRQQNNVEIMDERQQRVVMMKAMIDHEERMNTVEDRIASIETKVDEQITLFSGEQRKVQRAVASRVYGMVEDSNIRSEYFRQLHREIKDRWAVSSYKDVRRIELQELLNYINAWRPRAA
ncbi:Rha family transcriptional regulator [Paenibacillus sp. RUD330]|uniref:Rha family transcriptional regulator n=1 Tax=Paenibacillus sp. RUD330 TaxID=2023772 RepID=UPI000B928F7E|nr:Rha family transcriptional regulator [Paenibacillus sp. RUD330]ASS66248.1 hypothetical protein CIC07_08855 [Paenibacillus sp. RUD330]